MNKLWILLKANIINTLGLNKLRKKSTGKISVWAIILVIIVSLATFGFAFLYLFLFGGMFAEQGMPSLILPLGLTAGTLISFMTTLTTANGYLFRSNDFDMLMALPVKPRTIFASKLFYLLLINYVTLFVLYLPTVIVYAVYNPTDLVFWILSLPVFLLMPLAIITIASLLSYLIGFITSKFRYKNFLSLILTLFFLVFIMYISFQTSAIEENPGKYAQDINQLLNKLRVGDLIYKSLLGDWLSLLIFIAISTLPFYGFVYLVGRSYAKASMRTRGAYVRKNFKMTTLKKSTQNRALFKREIKRYFSSNIYVMNTLVGPVLTTILLVIMAINMKPILKELPIDASIQGMIPFGLTAMFSFMLGITSTTSCSLSMEGKQFWIIRTAPVQEKQIFNAKIFLNLLVTIPFIVINVIIANFIIEINIIDSIFMLIIPSLLAFYMSVSGLFLNILFPRFDIENETKIVKQSVSVLLTMLSGFLGSAMVLVPGIIVVNNTSNILLGYLILLGIEALLVITVSFLLSNIGIKRYKKLVS
jgi:ABC-2 type transport system permease protein